MNSAVELIGTEYYSISQCSCCGKVGIHYNNILISLQEHEFKAFVRSFCRINFSQSCDILNGRTEQVIINTPQQNLYFTFDEFDFHEFKDVLQQSLLLMQARSLVNG